MVYKISKLDKDTSIVIPCYNCATTIGYVVQSCLCYCPNVIVIDDGSVDDSAKIASESGGEVRRLGRNYGVGHALYNGFTVSLERGYTTIVTLDADGAHNPNDIPLLTSKHRENNFILTVGNRWGHYSPNNIPSGKYWANKFASCLVNKVLNTNLTDVACGFRVLSAPLINHLHQWDSFSFLYSMLFESAQIGTIGHADVEVCYDASSFWVTKQNELLNLLEICSTWASNNNLKQRIVEIKNDVQNWNKFEVAIIDKNAITDILVVYPVIEYKGFVFQHQHNTFSYMHDIQHIRL